MTQWYSRPIVPVTDAVTARGFYVDALGFSEVWRYEEADKLSIVQVSRAGCELILSSQWPEKAGSAMQFVSLDLDVLIALRADLEARGVTVEDGRWGYPLMILRDADGNQLLFPYPADDEGAA